MQRLVNIKVNYVLIKVLVFILPILVCFCFYFLHEFPPYVDRPNIYRTLISEDFIIEYSTAFFFLIASIFGAFLAVRFLKQRKYLVGISYIILSLGMFFVFGEEISWGQRIFDIPTFGYFQEHNIQYENTIHNLSWGTVDVPYFFRNVWELIGFYGSFSWMLLLIDIKKFRFILNPYFIPKWYLMSYFMPITITSLYIIYTKPDFANWYWEKLLWEVSEPSEFLMSIGFFLFVFINFFRENSNSNLINSNQLSINFSKKYSTPN